MPHINIEFKARTADLHHLEEKLKPLRPKFIGQDFQTDTYFRVPAGRLKLREGNIENALIYYERENGKTAKQSNVILYRHEPDANLKALLEKVHGVKIVVRKKRKIYFVDRVKIHFDEVENLGTFVEVEAIGTEGSQHIKKLQHDCERFARIFGIKPEDYIAQSYSDLLAQKDLP